MNCDGGLVYAYTDRSQGGHRLQLLEDIETVVDALARGIDEEFSLALSDGTLVQGALDSGRNACRIGIVSDGAAMAKTTRHGLGEALDLNGKFGRIPLACGAQTLQQEARAEEADVQQMTLDIDVCARL